MPKAGRFTYPFYDIEAVVDKLKKAYDEIKDKQMKRPVVAQVLGMAEKGGGFSYVIAAWEDYGLTENQGGLIVLTDLGQRAILGEVEAMKEAVNRIDLFKELYRTYQQDAKADRVETFLRNKANLEPIKAQDLSSNISKIYMNVAKYITLADEAAQPQASTGRRDNRMEKQLDEIPEGSVGSFKSISGDIIVVDSDLKIAFIKQIWEDYKKKTTRASGQAEDKKAQ